MNFKRYKTTKGMRIAGAWIDRDQVRKAEFGDDVIHITWHDGSTEKFATGLGEKSEKLKDEFRHILWEKLCAEPPPQLLPAAPGFELIHFDAGWMFGRVNTKDADPATFDIAAGFAREPVVAWEIQQPDCVLWDHGRNAIGCGRLRQFWMDTQTGPNWTALILPNGTLFAEVREHSYFDIDDKPMPPEYAEHTALDYFESIPKWIEYIRHDWAGHQKWWKALQLEWEKAEAESAPKVAAAE
jgi:hypothetical protein